MHFNNKTSVYTTKALHIQPQFIVLILVEMFNEVIVLFCYKYRVIMRYRRLDKHINALQKLWLLYNNEEEDSESDDTSVEGDKIVELIEDQLLEAYVIKEEMNDEEARRTVGTFKLEDMSDIEVMETFRMTKSDICKVVQLLNIPPMIKLDNRMKIPQIEAFCVLLARLATRAKLYHLSAIFFRETSVLSRIITEMLIFIQANWLHLVQDWAYPRQTWLDDERLRTYSIAIETKCQIDKVIGFIDGTLIPISKPSVNHRPWYNGRKRFYCANYGCVTLPCGLTLNVYGPVAGARHDTHLASRAQVETNLQRFYSSWRILADKGYVLSSVVLTPYKRRANSQLTADQYRFNLRLSSVRIAVEWSFGKLYQLFPFIFDKYRQKIGLQPVGAYVKVGIFLQNIIICCSGCQTSEYFGVKPPIIEDYLR